MATLNGLEETLYFHNDSNDNMHRYDANSSTSSENERLKSCASHDDFSSSQESQEDGAGSSEEEVLEGADWLSWGSKFRLITSDKRTKKEKNRKLRRSSINSRATFRIGNSPIRNKSLSKLKSSRAGNVRISSRYSKQSPQVSFDQDVHISDERSKHITKENAFAKPSSATNDYESKHPNKKHISFATTPTLTASLSSSMSHTSKQSGYTLFLDPNAFDDIQHWNVDDGKFHISISPSCSFFKEENDAENNDNNKIPSPIKTPQLCSIDHENSSKVRQILLESDEDSCGSSSYEFGIKDTEAYCDDYVRSENQTTYNDSSDTDSDVPVGMPKLDSPDKVYTKSIQHRKMDAFGLEIPLLQIETEECPDKTDANISLALKNSNKLSSNSFSQVFNNKLNDKDSSVFSNDEIKLESKHSAVSELSLTPIFHKQLLDKTKAHSSETHTTLPQYHYDYPLSPGIHRRVGVHEQMESADLLNIADKKNSPLPTLPNINNRSRATSYSKLDRRNILKKSFKISFWLWVFLLSITFTISMTMTFFYTSPYMADISFVMASMNPSKDMNVGTGGGLRKSSFNKEQNMLGFNFQKIPDIDNMDASKDKRYSILLSNQSNGPILSNAVTDTVEYLESCSSVENIVVDLDDAASKIVWPSLKKIGKVILLSDKETKTDFYSAMTTTSILLIDQLSGIYSCHDMDQAFQVWKQNSNRLIGFEGLHFSLSDKKRGTESHLVKNVHSEGSYNIISTSSMFIHRDYIHALDPNSLYSCHGLGLSALISVNSRLSPIQMKGTTLEFGWDRLFVDEKSSFEQKTLTEGRDCVDELISKVGQDDLPLENYVYIGVA